MRTDAAPRRTAGAVRQSANKDRKQDYRGRDNEQVVHAAMVTKSVKRFPAAARIIGKGGQIYRARVSQPAALIQSAARSGQVLERLGVLRKPKP